MAASWPKLPQELMDQIIDEVAADSPEPPFTDDSLRALLNVSLASRLCLDRCRTHIFRLIRFGYPRPMRRTTEFERIHHLHTILLENPKLGLYFQCLRIGSSVFQNNEWDDNSASVTLALSQIIRRSEMLEEFHLSHNFIPLDWNDLSQPAQLAIYTCCALPTIEKLAFHGINNLPITLLVSCPPSLKRLSLHYVSVSSTDVSTMNLTLPTWRLVSLHINDSQTALRALAKFETVFCDLEELHLSQRPSHRSGQHTSTVGVEAMQESIQVIGWVSPTLTELCVDFSFPSSESIRNVKGSFRENPIHFSKLKDLKIRIYLTKDNVRDPSSFATVPDMLYHLLATSENIEKLRIDVFQLNLNLRDSSLSRSIISLGTGWGKLDNLLSSGQLSKLQFVNLTIMVIVKVHRQPDEAASAQQETDTAKLVKTEIARGLRRTQDRIPLSVSIITSFWRQ